MDQKALDQALARFEGFRNNLPVTISENQVKEYHSIVDAIGLATGETQLHIFKIGDHELEHKVIGRRGMSFSGRPGSVKRSQDKRCDSNRFQSQVDALSHYLESQGYRKSHTPKSPRQSESRPTHSVHIERMYGSAIQQGTTSSQININFDVKSTDFKSLIQDIKAKIPSLNLDQTSANQLYSDIGTIEVQVAAPAPKPSVIADSLSSIKAILENAVGNVIAVGIVYEIVRFLSGH
jgi:hypothetical protein